MNNSSVATSSKPASTPAPAGLVAYIDGASRGNPGPSSYGVVIQDARGTVLENLSQFLGDGTNNVAEYRALLAALEYASSLKTRRLKIYCDSELVARQMQGHYRVRSPDLKPLHERARKLASQIGQFSIEHLPREQNRQADLLANKALDQARNKIMEKTAGSRAPASGPRTHFFSAVVEAGRLKPLMPVPELEEGAEYEVHASKRSAERSSDR